MSFKHSIFSGHSFEQPIETEVIRRHQQGIQQI